MGVHIANLAREHIRNIISSPGLPAEKTAQAVSEFGLGSHRELMQHVQQALLQGDEQFLERFHNAMTREPGAPGVPIPNPVPTDGLCCECHAEKAVTRDGKLCRKCLSSWTRQQNNAVHSLGSRGAEERGRKSLSQVLGGMAEMNLSGDEDDE